MCAALSSGELVLAALCRGRDDAAELESRCLAELETGAATRFINGLRMAKQQNVCMVVGAFGILEAELQRTAPATSSVVAPEEPGRDHKHDSNPLRDFIREQRARGEHDLAERLSLFVDAINVLKHGRGPSHDTLLKRSAPFLRVKRSHEELFCEGDVSELSTLVDVNSQFMAAAVETIEDVVRVRDEARRSQRSTVG